MLTSLMVPRQRPLRAHIALNNGFAVYNASLPKSRHQIQARAFRFGLWPSNNSYHHELRRRWRILKQEHANAINRELPWHDHSLAEELDLKRTVSRHRSRWISQDQLDDQKTGPYRHAYAAFRVDAESWRPDLERFRTDIFKNRRCRQSHSDIKSQREADMGSEHFNSNGTTKTSDSRQTAEPESNPVAEQDYAIDPITNRKVQKREDRGPEIEIEPPTRAFDTYKSQFTPFAPPHLDQESPPVYSNGKPSDSELSKYAKTELDDWSSTGTQPSPDSTKYATRPETSPIFDTSALKDEYALNHLPPEDPVDEHGDSHAIQNAEPNETTEKPSNALKNPDVIDQPNSPDVSHTDLNRQPDSESDKLQNELGKYGPYIYNQESTKDTPEEPKDLEDYRYRTSENSECLTKLPAKYDDLYKYEPSAFDEIKDEDQSFEKYGDLEKYKTLETQQFAETEPLERDIIAESLKEYENKECHDSIPDNVDNVHNVSKTLPRMKLPEGHIFSKHFPVQKEAETAHSSGVAFRAREEMHRRMDELSETSDAMDREINSNLHKNLRSLENGQTMESSPSFSGDFVRGTTEESQSDMNTHKDGPIATGNNSAVLETPYSEEVKNLDRNVEINEATKQAPNHAQHSSRLEPALDRYTTATKGDRPSSAFEADLYSKEPQGLETSFSEECGGRDTMPLYTRTYGNEPGQIDARTKLAENEVDRPPEYPPDSYYHRDPEVDGIPQSEPTGPTRDRGATQPEEPTIYKILAYDPAMQNVNVAETTSVLPDLASPLSPTEVIPRLSNPSKFFPYFSPLQAEGFEIVSGRGNVLVFRQVRPGKSAAQGGATVNPIDMMGRPPAVPNAAAFVSPTGFVNYDVLQVEEAPAEPPFRSGLHVHREEPVFSGQRLSSGNVKSKKPKRRLVRKVVIGGAGVAGISYAFGVVSEYFTTGGADGQGPSGFSPT
ncbi:hypothetical protein F4861DRAFT_514530 [Xylaria intraflava]|nr:hypothetical protein F4861DRAFT_514530 [Xylaria intraflava]